MFIRLSSALVEGPVYINSDRIFSMDREYDEDVGADVTYVMSSTATSGTMAVRETPEEIMEMIGQSNLSVVAVSLDAGAYPPTRAHQEDAGLDLLSPVDTFVPAQGSVIIDSGVHVAIPTGSVGLLLPKSGLNVKHGIVSHGVIDAGYSGSIRVKLYNLSDNLYVIHKGDKITQLVITACQTPGICYTKRIKGGARGDKGFGSTGR